MSRRRHRGSPVNPPRHEVPAMAVPVPMRARRPGATVTVLAEEMRPARAPTPTGLAMQSELDLVVAAQRDPAARTRLLEAFRPLIASVARPYARSTSVHRSELMQ